MRITISGPPGSGKTTVCSLLSEELSIDSVVFGKIFREYAAERGLTLSELGAIAEKDPSIDETIDSRIVEIARTHESMIFESRLSAYMLSRNGISAFKVYLDASPKVRVQRIGRRDGESEADAERNTLDRQTSEAKRYMKYYNIDINDKSIYDLVINTDDLMPEDVVEKIIRSMKGTK